jgi:hypothetical protein
MITVSEQGLRRIYAGSREEETGGWRKLHNEKNSNLY